MSYAVSRREFLNQLALYLPAVPLAWSVACTRAPPPPEWRPLALRASAWFHRQDLRAVRLIGAHFLTRVGRDYDGLKVELGPTLELLKEGGDRGLYKTTDGGKTWKAVLEISENTGVTDLCMDPRDPDVLYAASYQRRRNVGVLIGGGGTIAATEGKEVELPQGTVLRVRIESPVPL